MARQLIDRRAVVDRHSVRITGIQPRSPLSVGNGEFCFTADVTGLQSLPELYPVGPRDRSLPAGTLLGTQAQWGWHSIPAEEDFRLEDCLVEYESPRGRVTYVDMGGSISGGTEQGTPERDLWLRANPHRLDLGRIGLVSAADLRPLTPDRLSRIDQRLDLWGGELRSRYAVDGRPVEVVTVCHPEQDVLAVQVRAEPGLLALKLAFPYGNDAWHDAADWTRPERHHTSTRRTSGGWSLQRTLDSTRYQVELTASPESVLEDAGPHTYLLPLSSPDHQVVLRFSKDAGRAAGAVPSFDTVRRRAREHWEQFWSTGGAVSFDATDDSRAVEIERRTVLSQYLTAIQCAGSLPPQETGLVCNSWRGRFHLEMHWWHTAHFALWGRPELLLRSLRWYASALPAARETARRQGYPGGRWPKQVGPDARESPSSIGPFLVWQQPHPIYLAELAYRAQPTAELLDEFADVVVASADFMAGLAVGTERGFELAPPLIPAQESYGGMRARVWNPTFELVYWAWALRVAARWSERRGRTPDPRWLEVADGMVTPPVRNGVYQAIGVEPFTIRTDHPSMLCALGVLPATDKIDPDVMAATLDDVLADWKWDSTWGWDYPVIAMCAARLGRPEQAVDALLMGQDKNTVLPNGHNWQSASLPLYLPGNGGLLAAVAVMAGGWDARRGRPAPGFPSDWMVRSEGLVPAP